MPCCKAEGLVKAGAEKDSGYLLGDIEAFQKAVAALIAAGTDLSALRRLRHLSHPRRSARPRHRPSRRRLHEHHRRSSPRLRHPELFRLIEEPDRRNRRLAALFYVSLPAFIGMLMIMGAIFYFSK